MVPPHNQLKLTSDASPISFIKKSNAVKNFSCQYLLLVEKTLKLALAVSVSVKLFIVKMLKELLE
jgi:hypothetical protein